MQRHFTSGRGLAFSNQIGDTLTNVSTTAQNLRASASFPTATLRLDAAFVNAPYGRHPRGAVWHAAYRALE